MPKVENSAYERLTMLLAGDDGDRIRGFDQAMRSRGECEIGIVLTSKSSRLSEVGPLITRTDRELRRAAAILGSDSEGGSGHYPFGDDSWNRPRPISAKRGGLQIDDATVGSLHLLVRAYGEVLSILTSVPLQALTTLMALGQSVGAIRFWRRDKDPLAGMSARQFLNTIKELGGDPATILKRDPVSLEIKMQPTPGERMLERRDTDTFEMMTPTFNIDEVSFSGEIIARGRLITYIRRYPDGTQDIIHVEG